MTDLVKRLRIKAGVIEMGEMIAWGSDSALMREAADALEMAAPGVQGEQVGYVSQDFLDGKWNMDHIAKSDEGQISRTIPVFAKPPQPVEQQSEQGGGWPSMPDEFYEGLGWMHAECCSALDRGEDPRTFEVGAMVNRCINDLSRPQPAEQQPSPDVAGLMEALECALETMENVDGANDCSRGIDAVEEALAAWRGNDGEK